MTCDKLLLGFSEVDITPDRPAQMIGFGRADETSRGVMAPLMAQVSVWYKGESRCCLIAIDHIGFSREHADSLRDAVGEALGAGREQVMLCFSHTHAAPNDSAEAEWYLSVRERVLTAARKAAETAEPVNVGWANGYADIGVNRRDGSDALDRRVGVLTARSCADGKLKLMLLRLTAHANVLKGDNYLISPDYFGVTRDMLGREFGCPAMLTQGASGDIAPRFFDSALNPPDAQGERFTRSKDALSLMATEVCGAVRGAMDELKCDKQPKPLMLSRIITLYADVPTEAQARRVYDDAMRFCGINGDAWLAEARRLREAGVTEQSESVEVQYFSLGDMCICGVSNEVMCQFALSLKQLTRNEYFFFGGYTNACTGYFPTEEEFDKGGYEVYWSMLDFYMYYGRVYPLRRDSCKQLIGFVALNAPSPSC